MLTLLTACGRDDLLIDTIYSLCQNQKHLLEPIIIHEDSLNGRNIQHVPGIKVSSHLTGGIGQHASIDQFLKYSPEEKYYLHCEDDWSFNNQYDWIEASKIIMEADPSVIKVLARKQSPHPCAHTRSLSMLVANKGTLENLKYGYIEPWTNPADEKTWYGFSWNPGVTRLDLLRKFSPLLPYEQDVSRVIYDAGYKVVELSVPVYEHIGEGRSTH